MKKISVRNPSENGDRQFVKIWYVLLTLVLGILILTGSHSIIGYAGVAILFVFGSIGFYTMRWVVVDEAFDCVDHLIFRKGRRDYQVQIHEIEGLGHPFANATHLITVKTLTNRRTAKKFTFRAAKYSGWFKVPPIFYELQDRVAAAKQM